MLFRSASVEFRAPVLVVATGGLSIPKIGATSFGYDLAKQFGLKIREPWPGLVPLVLQPEDKSHFCDLAGVSTEVVASCNSAQFREKMLITHRGLSGPAILQISTYWKVAHPIVIDLAPGRDLTSALRDPASRDRKASRSLAAARAEFRKQLPSRLADRWLDLHAPPTKANARSNVHTNLMSNSALAKLETQVHAWTMIPAGTEGYEKAEVTAGGVDTDELSAKTMESRKAPGLFFIGEVVDVTGHLGGFNFQWAWSSGAAAGRAL